MKGLVCAEGAGQGGATADRILRLDGELNITQPFCGVDFTPFPYIANS